MSTSELQIDQFTLRFKNWYWQKADIPINRQISSIPRRKERPSGLRETKIGRMLTATSNGYESVILVCQRWQLLRGDDLARVGFSLVVCLAVCEGQVSVLDHVLEETRQKSQEHLNADNWMLQSSHHASIFLVKLFDEKYVQWPMETCWIYNSVPAWFRGHV